MLGKLKKSMQGAGLKIKSATNEIIDSTSMKLAGKVFRVNNKRYKARRLIAEGTSHALKAAILLVHYSVTLITAELILYSTKLSSYSASSYH